MKLTLVPGIEPRHTLPTAGTAVLGGVVGDGWPLVGRAEEIALVTEAWRGGTRTIVLSGAAGVGTTRLAHELAARVPLADPAVEHVRAALDGGDVPLGAWAPLLGGVTGAATLGATIHAAFTDLVERARRSPLVLVVDDAHLLDDASTVLLRTVAASNAVWLVVALDLRHPGADRVASLWRDEQALLVELQPLAEHEVGALLRAALGAPADRATLRRLWRATRGAAGPLRVTVDDGLRTGRLAERDGCFVWDGPLVGGATLARLVQRRQEMLGEDARRALEIVVAAAPIGLRELRALVSPRAVEELERSGLVDVVRDGDRSIVVVRDPLVADHVAVAMPASHRAETAGHLARGLTASGARRFADVLKIAGALLDEGAAAEPGVFLRAAHVAIVLGDPDAAERCVEALARRGAGGTETQYLRGAVHALRGAHERAVAAWSSQQEALRPSPLSLRAAAAAAHTLAVTLGRSRDAVQALAEARATHDDRDGHALLDSVRLLSVDARHSPAVVARPGTGPPGATPGDEVWLRQWLAAGSAQVLRGRCGEVLAGTGAAYRVARRLRDEWPLATLHVAFTRFLALLCSGALADAERCAREGLERSLGRPDRGPRAYWTYALASSLLWQGHCAAAIGRLEEAGALAASCAPELRRVVLLSRATARALVGDVERAGDDLEAGAGAPPGILSGLAGAARARGALLAAQGSTSAAIALVSRSADRCGRRGLHVAELLGRRDVARWGAPEAAAPHLESLARFMDEPLAHVFLDEARALADRDGDRLLEVATRAATLGLWMDAAECTAAACRAFAREGRRSDAAAAANRAADLGARTDARCTPLLAAGLTPDALSAREREVATLAALGATDREIAAQLFISVRTVHAHLRTVYTKLGVPGRTGLRDALGLAPV